MTDIRRQTSDRSIWIALALFLAFCAGMYVDNVIGERALRRDLREVRAKLDKYPNSVIVLSPDIAALLNWKLRGGNTGDAVYVADEWDWREHVPADGN